MLLLSYTQCSVALTAYTSRYIEGSAPYLTFDGGQTRATSTDSLLSIKLQDGQVITPSTNTSSIANPIVLPYVGSTLGNIETLVPSSVSSVSLSDLITRYNYWRDDDGDELDTNGVMASGSLSVSFTDNDGNTVSRSDALDKCKAPYRVTLSSARGYLQTRYGVPNRTNFSDQTVTYYVNPYGRGPSVCYFVSHARPNLGNGRDNYAGPSNIWNPDKGFLTQSNDSLFYDRNFPTTGADGLYFDLLIDGVDASQLTWSPVTWGGITATVTSVTPGDSWLPNVERRKTVARVKLSGPSADSTQIESDNPSSLIVPFLPLTFELVGKDSRGNEVRYGFVLQKWFVHRGNKADTQPNQSTWCSRLGYRLSDTKDLTNSVKTSSPSISGALPSSSGNYYKRHIGAGFFTEWGYMRHYADAGFTSYYWTSDPAGRRFFYIYSSGGNIHIPNYNDNRSCICTTP
ncbi:hypothetical protein GA0061081_102311 [Gilliamella bombicola]|uniref:Uncharacterized protein n=1 Tax=Gilliamella bombicola TaxID=1798182 RepID=A0A1C4AA46_9GAMM|nr:hypothetical protein GA0061081_102311 [Gilliamella bombicola]